MYYEINENAARRAKNANSFRDYAAGSATAGYRASVDKAVQIAEAQKERVDSMYHEKIDGLLDTYCRKLAANLNHGYEIDARVPSMMIAGGSNFPVAKKEKQNTARDRNMQEWNDIQGLLDKVKSVGMGGISSDDPNAVDKLREKLARLEADQKRMKALNAYWRKHRTMMGCPGLTDDAAARIDETMKTAYSCVQKNGPCEAWKLQNNNANMRRIRERIEALERKSARAEEVMASLSEGEFDGWEFVGGRAVRNHGENRLQLLFDGKPDEVVRTELKRRGFRWSPSQKAWQRQLSGNAEYDARSALKAVGLME